MRLIHWDNVRELRQAADDWDALWRDSDVSAPTARATHVALWLEHFAPKGAFRCLLVEVDGGLAAALPLMQTRIKGIVPAGGAVANCWSAGGQLLVHPQAPDAALELLARGIQQLPWPLLWLQGVNPTTESWRRFLAACERTGLPHEFRQDCEVGLIEINHDWPAFEARWTRNHARNMNKARRRLEELGVVSFHGCRVDNASHAECLLSRAMDIEQRSWKARQGGSLIGDSLTRSFFVQQAGLLANWNALEFHFLDVNGLPIAFEYGYRSKGVHFAHKTGYDDAFSACSPGQLLMQDLLLKLHGDYQIDAVDFLGPLSEAHRRWTQQSYPEGRLLIASSGVFGHALWRTYCAARQCLPRARAADASVPELQPAGLEH